MAAILPHPPQPSRGYVTVCFEEVCSIIKKTACIALGIFAAIGRGFSVAFCFIGRTFLTCLNVIPSALRALRQHPQPAAPTIIQPSLTIAPTNKEPFLRQLLEDPALENKTMIDGFSSKNLKVKEELLSFLPKELLDANLPYVYFLYLGSEARIKGNFNKEKMKAFYDHALRDPKPSNRFVSFIIIAPDVRYSSANTNSMHLICTKKAFDCEKSFLLELNGNFHSKPTLSSPYSEENAKEAQKFIQELSTHA